MAPMRCGERRAACRVWRFVVALLAILGMGGHADAEEVPGQVLVKSRGPAVAGGAGARLQGQGPGLQVPAGARIVKPLALPGWHLVELPPGMPSREAIRWFRERPEIQSVEPNQRYRLHAAPSDPQWPWLHGLTEIGAPAAWESGTGRSNIVVAVLDTGVDTRHPDLAENLWRNTDEIAGNGIDDDKNGIIDDVFGADFADDDGDPEDDAGHGTHVAGTIGAVANNGRGVAGVCWQVRVMAVRVLRADGSADTPGFLSAFSYVVAMKRRGADVRAINCSWGGGSASAALKEAIQEAGAAGILVVCSAGNDRQNNDVLPTFPAGYDCPEILSVAASGTCDELANFSNYGRTTVHLGAPGRDILSTFRGGERYAVLSGTSMAAPHVSGAAALLASLRPDLTVGQLRELLLSTVHAQPAWSGIVSSGGRLDLAAAVRRLASGPLPEGSSSGPSAAPSARISSPTRMRSGRWADGDSTEPVISADGRWVAFSSAATNLVAGDIGGFVDVFLADRVSGIVTRVSQTPGGVGGNGDSVAPSISADGRWVAFASLASNFVATDTDRGSDIYVWDRQTRQLELVSVRADGRASGNGASEAPALSADGRWIAFASEARDLVANDRNALKDVFVRDRVQKVTERVSVTSGGAEATGPSESPSIDAEGRRVAFHSLAANLVAGDRNAAWDVFVRDRTTGITEIASLAGASTQGGDDSVFPILSGDGRYVLFHSLAENFDALGGGYIGVFLRDLRDKTLVRVNTRPGGTAAGDAFVDGLSADGRYATFTTDDPNLGPGGAPELYRAWVYDRLTGGLGELGVNDGGYSPDDNTFYGRPNADGRYITYTSYSANPMPGHGTGVGSIFVEDRGVDRPDLAVRVAKAGARFAGLGTLNPQAPQRAGELVPRGERAVFEVLLANGGESRSFLLRLGWTGQAPGPAWGVGVTSAAGGGDITAAITGGGWQTPVLAPGSNLVLRLSIDRAASDAGGAVFGTRMEAFAAQGGVVLDAVTAVAETSAVAPGSTLASRAQDGVPAGRNAEVPSVSGDGRRVVFSSESDHLEARSDTNFQSDIFLFDRDTRQLSRISDASATRQANADSRYPSISADGRRVAFQSRASNLVSFDTNDVEDVFVKDLQTGAMTRVSVAQDGRQGTRGSETGMISADGRFVAFTSLATNLVAGDTNRATDVFLRSLETGFLECVSRTAAGVLGNADSEVAAVTGDARFVLFSSYADNLGPEDTNRLADVYLLDRGEGVIELVSRNTNGVAANGASRPLSISDDGHWVTFQSLATDLVPGGATPERWGYVLNRWTGQVLPQRSVVGVGPIVSLQSRGAVVSADGNLWAVGGRPPCGVKPSADQVWVLNQRQGTMSLVSGPRVGPLGVLGDDHTFAGRFSPDGRFLTLESYAVNLLGEVARGAGQIQVADLSMPVPGTLARRMPEGPWRGPVGNEIVTLEDRTVSLTSRGGVDEGRDYGVRLVNRGSASDRFRVLAVRPGSEVGSVRVVAFVAPSEDVSEAVFGAGWTTPLLQPGETLDLQVETALVPNPAKDLRLEFQVISLSNPYRLDQAVVVTLADRDADDLPDGWEREHFGSLDRAGRGTDTDGDGATDFGEWVAGTDPGDAGDLLRLTLERVPSSGGVYLDWKWRPHRYLQVERSLEGGLFEPVGASTATSSGLSVRIRGDGLSERFRLRADPP